MNTRFFIANWKSNKTTGEVRSWFEEMAKAHLALSPDSRIIICPSFQLLPLCQNLIQEYELPFLLGAQDISPFPEGRYTGAVNGKQIREFAEYVLIGHSERRNHFGETEDILVQKVQQAVSAGVAPIFLAQSEDGQVPDGVAIVVYEPATFISPAPADSPEDVAKKAEVLHKRGFAQVVYGGNVTAENVQAFCEVPSLSGVLIGNASLDAATFTQLLTNAHA